MINTVLTHAKCGTQVKVQSAQNPPSGIVGLPVVTYFCQQCNESIVAPSPDLRWKEVA
jgi:hypothetical protein